ncbi:tetraacyldisaccharide 4'-kinase [Reinekea forsetii]|nr:tetraacyldisaccharide 4'-kinase [Reinekea forsetii]
MDFWYRSKLPWFAFLLQPWVVLVNRITRQRRKNRRLEGYLAPVLVVGNITVGGTGKTPMIQYLAQLCKKHSIKVGVVSRGYGGKSDQYPLTVSKAVPASVCGDEPKLLSESLNIPVVVSPNRHEAVQRLLSEFEVDLVISDDGLQHYNMARDIELVMLDGIRGLGNGHLLPLGPLREQSSRLSKVDFIVSKGVCDLPIQIDAHAIPTLAPPKNSVGEELSFQRPIKLVTAIGNGDSFLTSVQQLGYEVSSSVFLTDHAVIPEKELKANTPVVITEKDAVKLNIADYPHVYVAPLLLTLPHSFDEQLLALVRDKVDEKSRHHSRSV